MPSAQLRDDGPLVLGVAEREEEADGDRLGVERRQGAQVERLELAVRRHTPGNSHAALERHERGRVLGTRPVEVRTVLPSEMEEMLEARRRDERRPSTPPLEKRVRGDRRPVGEAVDVFCADLPGGREHGLLLAARRRHLRRRDLPVRDQDGVRERPADVDSERCASRRFSVPVSTTLRRT